NNGAELPAPVNPLRRWHKESTLRYLLRCNDWVALCPGRIRVKSTAVERRGAVAGPTAERSPSCKGTWQPSCDDELDKSRLGGDLWARGDPPGPSRHFLAFLC